jgi:hypothetical protein
MNTCVKCGAEFFYAVESHKCKGQWEAECAAAGVAQLVSVPLLSWVDECMEKQRKGCA